MDARQHLSKAAVAQRTTVFSLLSTLRTLEVGMNAYETPPFGPVAHLLVPALTHLTELRALRLKALGEAPWGGDDNLAVLARPLSLLSTLTCLHL